MRFCRAIKLRDKIASVTSVLESFFGKLPVKEFCKSVYIFQKSSVLFFDSQCIFLMLTIPVKLSHPIEGLDRGGVGATGDFRPMHLRNDRA